jgi:hypothetical protein
MQSESRQILNNRRHSCATLALSIYLFAASFESRLCPIIHLVGSDRRGIHHDPAFVRVEDKGPVAVAEIRVAARADLCLEQVLQDVFPL